MAISRTHIIHSAQIYFKYLTSITNRLRLKQEDVFYSYLRSVITLQLKSPAHNIVVLIPDTDII